MQNEILVAGMHMPDNQFTRFVMGYGYKVIHRPDAEVNREVPLTAGALICTSQISHGLRDKVSEFYKANGLPWIETRSDSTVEIKDKFESLFVKPVQLKIQNLSIEDQLMYILFYFNKPGTKVHSTKSSAITKHYIPNLSDQYSATIFAKMNIGKIIEKIEGSGSKGMWRLKGFDKDQLDLLSRRIGTPLPKTWLREEEQVNNPEPITEQPAEETQKKHLTELEERISKDMQDFKGSVNQQLNTIVRAVERMALSVNKDSKEAMLLEINNQLNTMPVHELLKVKTMLDIWQK